MYLSGARTSKSFDAIDTLRHQKRGQIFVCLFLFVFWTKCAIFGLNVPKAKKTGQL